MIRFTEGNIFKAKVEAIVNTVNLEGVMGKGLALQFKKQFPDNFKAYEKACKNKELSMGRMFTFERTALDDPRLVINFPTKAHWKNKSSLSDIKAGLLALKQEIERFGIKSIAIPPLGCGLGGLDWLDVKLAIEQCFVDAQGVDIVVFAPLKGESPAPVPAMPTKLTPAMAIILSSFRRYMVFATTVELTFVEAHKIAYFIQVLGIPLRLQFSAWRYGPYARNLPHVFSGMEGTYIEGFRDGTAKAFDRFSLLPAAGHAEEIIQDDRYKKVSTNLECLLEGFESPTGVELLATIHWLAKEGTPLELDAMSIAMGQWCNNREGWGDRKKRLFPDMDLQMGIERIKTIT